MEWVCSVPRNEESQRAPHGASSRASYFPGLRASSSSASGLEIATGSDNCASDAVGNADGRSLELQTICNSS